MMPPELQSRLYRPYLSTSASASSSLSSASSFGNGGSPNPSASDSRFSKDGLRAQRRVAVALVPCGAFLLELGGTPVAATLTLGLMISYIIDTLNFKSGAFFGVWFSLVFSQIVFFFFSSSLFYSFNSWPLAALAAFLCAETNFLVGIWTSLNFKWIQIENPSIVLALERLLFACVPFAAASLFTFTIVSAVGMNNASY